MKLSKELFKGLVFVVVSIYYIPTIWFLGKTLDWYENLCK